jgi:succinyl-CoA synthetase alpha subunit
MAIFLTENSRVVVQGMTGSEGQKHTRRMIGEIDGNAEERAAAYNKEHVTEPVVGYVAGFTAPEGKTMGHAGAIVSGSSGTAASKREALEAVSVKVGKTPCATAQLMRDVIGKNEQAFRAST